MADPLDDRSSSEAGRGRSAESPSEIPAKGWLDVAWRTGKRFSDDNVTLIAGGLAMYALLSVFPALAALVSIYGMFATPGDVIKQMSSFAGVLPPGVWDIFSTELQSIAKTGQSTLTFAAVLGIVVALWSARAAMSSLMTATNIAYREREKRGLLKTTLLSLAFTASAIAGFLLMLTLGVAIPLALAAFGAAEWAKAAVSVLRVALLWALMALGLAVIYRYAPARERAQWHWVSAGSIIAATLWLAASALFAFYVTNFAGYAKTYGALGGVVVLLMWFFISSVVVVLGAQINAELERQTVKDTTILQNAPIGARGAFAADTVGPPVGAGKAPTESVNPRPQTSGGHEGDAELQGLGAADHVSKGANKRRGKKELRDLHSHSDSWVSAATAASDAGALARKASQALDSGRSPVGRIMAAWSAVGLCVRVLPAGVRVIRRHPLPACLTVAAVLWGVFETRAQRGVLASPRRHSTKE
jgi:membrane protein